MLSRMERVEHTLDHPGVSGGAPGQHITVAALGAIASIAVALVAFFDLQTNLPLLDEYARRWGIQQLVAGHGFQSLGSSPNIVQLLLAAPLAVAKTDPAVWRLTAVPFLAMQGVFVGLMARDLGAGKTWATVAGAAMICNPLNLSLSTGMMTETVFLALFGGAAWLSLRWLEDGRSRWTCIALAALATLQRPQAAGLAVAVVLGLLLIARRKRSIRSDVPAMAVLVLVTTAALAAPGLLGAISPALAGAAPTVGAPAPQLYGAAFVIFVLASLPAILGLVMLPFAVGLATGRRSSEFHSRLWWILPATLGLLALAFAGVFVVGGGRESIFVGNILGRSGLGATFLGGSKVSPFGPAVVILEVLSTASYLVLLLQRADIWTPTRLGSRGQLLVLHSATQVAFIVGHGELFDRYFLAVILPLLPIVAVAAAATPLSPAATTWAVLATLGAVVLYVIGTQDYLAWQVARHKAAQMAYAQAPVDQVEAGFEETAENIWLPADTDPSGTLPRHVAAPPRLELIFASPDDPRPGVSYSSLGPGRVVIRRNR
jgi:hypothetical protein